MFKSLFKRKRVRLHDAILRAADVIEADCGVRYRFMKTSVPQPGRPGCMLGLIGEQLGYKPGTDINVIAALFGVEDHGHFYQLLPDCRFYSVSSDAAARALRAIAPNYAEAA